MNPVIDWRTQLCDSIGEPIIIIGIVDPVLLKTDDIDNIIIIDSIIIVWTVIDGRPQLLLLDQL